MATTKEPSRLQNISAAFGNLLTSLFGRGSSANNSNPGLFGTFIGEPAIYPNPNAERFINDGYCGNGSVYTIVSRAARKFGSIPRYVYKVTDAKAEKSLKARMKQKGVKLRDLTDLQRKAYDEQVVENDFSELLARPNEKQGQDAFYELTYVFKTVTGESFIWLNRGDNFDSAGRPMSDEVLDKMPPLEMYVLPTQYVRLIPDPTDVWGVLGYQFIVSGQEHYIRKNDIIHWKNPNPKFDGVTRIHLRGFPALEAGNKWLTEDDSATDASVAMQQNDGAKGALFNKQLGNMSPEQKSKIDQMINRKVNNRSLKGAVTALEGEWGYVQMGQTGQEMEAVQVREKGFIRLCNLFGVPPMLFLTETTYANVEQAEKAFVTNLIAPDSASLRDEMNRVLLPAFGLDKTYTHDIDVSALPELQTEMKELVAYLLQAWWLTPNEKRKEMNQEASTDPNMDKVWVPNTILTMDDAAMADLNPDSFTNDKGPTDPITGRQISDPSKSAA